MDRINDIFRHPLYRENFDGLQKAEKDRRFCRHDLQHFLDVARISYIYSLEDGGVLPKDIVYAAALLHDIGRLEEITAGTPHDEAGAKISGRILADCGFSPEETDVIVSAILEHRNGHQAEAQEACAGTGRRLAQYLYKADKISRPCFQCGAAAECKWSEEKKNHGISV